MAARLIVVLRLSKRIKNIIAFAQNVATSMTGNPSFPSPTPPLATALAHVAAAEAAEVAVLSRALGSVQTRDARLAVVRSDLAQLRTYVQNVAAAAPPAEAPAIVAGSGFALRKPDSRDKPALAARQGSLSGTVELSARAVARSAAYDWEYSTDPKSWTALPQTMQSRTRVTGLVAGTVYSFRVQPLTRSGLRDWSSIVTMVVV